MPSLNLSTREKHQSESVRHADIIRAFNSKEIISVYVSVSECHKRYRFKQTKNKGSHKHLDSILQPHFGNETCQMIQKTAWNNFGKSEERWSFFSGKYSALYFGVFF